MGIDQGRTLRAIWSPTTGLIAVGLLVVVCVGVMLVIRPNIAAGQLGAGSTVTGTGYLIENADGRQVQLCLGGSRLVGPPSCSVVAIPVEGVRWNAVPGATRDDGVWYATHVTVRGTWSGSKITLGSVSAAPLPGSLPPVPNSCIRDLRKTSGIASPNSEAALMPLDAEVFDDPDRYAGAWRAEAASSEGLGPMVVEVVGKPSAVEPMLRRLYPYPLCLVGAKLSETELNSTLNLLGRATQDWRADVDYPSNRVIVSVAMLTDALHRRLEPYRDRIIVRQLIHPA